MGWYDVNSNKTTHPVGQKLPNSFGLHDMHGNVFEWCEDWFQEDFYRESAGLHDPLCENSGFEYRMIRGGGYGDGARVCRSALRNYTSPPDRDHALGFRAAWSSP